MRLLDRFRPIMIQHGDRAIRLARRHAVYVPDLDRDFDYWHGAVESSREHGVAVVDYSRPRLHRLLPSGDDFLFIGMPEHEVALWQENSPTWGVTAERPPWPSREQ